MKLWSKEALVLGGVYGVLDTPFSLLNLELISEILLVAFLISAILLCFNKTPKFVTYITSQFPQTAYYLSSIGWIIYFAIIGLITIIVIAGIFEWPDNTLKDTMKIFNFICLWGIPFSLLIAFIREKINKLTQ